jgi:purine nucleosidase
VIVPDEAARLRAIGTPIAEFCINIQATVATFCAEETKLAGFDLPDPIAMAYALDPEVATETRRMFLEVECESQVTRGMVVMDLLGFSRREANALVVMHADHGRFIEHLEATMRS